MSHKRKIVCSAIRNRAGQIICGVRHFDRLMHSQAEARADYETWRVAEQGFVDNRGEFVTREEAMQIAKAAGQAIDIEEGCGGDENTLYPEGLY